MLSAWRIPILVYHHVSPSIDYYTNTPPEKFAHQIETLASRCEFWTAGQAYAAYRAGEDPANRVILTFDDGYLDNFLYARPVLAKHGIKATFFVLSDFVGRTNSWNTKCSYEAQHMDWPEMQALIREGHEIGSHGQCHVALTKLSQNVADLELLRSRDTLSKKLGVDITSLAYPYGLTNAAVCRLAAQYYALGFSTVKSTQTDWNLDRYSLRRSYVPYDATDDALVQILLMQVEP